MHCHSKLGIQAPMVTLVHGTFVPNAPWTRRRSFFVHGLQQWLGPDVPISAFHWSGCNSHRLRLQAAEDLANHLESETQRHPTRRHLIIAHSHGGNVVLYALKLRPDLAKNIAAVVTLATPFLHVARRDIRGGIRMLSWILPLLLWLGMVLALGPLASMLDLSWQFVLILCAATGLVVLSARRIRRWLSRPLMRSLLSKQRRILAWLDPTPKVGFPLMYAHVSYDEAGMALRFLHQLGDVAHHSLDVLRRVIRLVLLLTFGMGFTGEAVDHALGQGSRIGEALATRGMGWVAAGACLYCLCMLMAFVWPKVVRGHGFGYGSESFIFNFLMTIFSSHEPPPPVLGRSCLVKVRGFQGLRHSHLYGSAEFLSRLREWVDGEEMRKDTVSGVQGHRRSPWMEQAVAAAIVLAMALSLKPSIQQELQRALTAPVKSSQAGRSEAI